MKQMIVLPHRGVDGILFGAQRDGVRANLGRAFKSGRRGTRSEYDFYEDLGFIYYDPSNACAAVEFVSEARVLYEGYELFAHPAQEAYQWALSQDPELVHESGFISRKLGLSMYAPLLDFSNPEPDERLAPAESFLIFVPGYYKSAEKAMADLGRPGRIGVSD